MAYEEDYFASALSGAMESYGVNSRRLGDLLRERGIDNITEKRISEYINGRFTPPFEKAKVMMETLEYPVSDEELMELLKRNRERTKEEETYVSTGSKELRLCLRLKLKKILPDIEVQEVEMLLKQRVAEVCGDESKMCAYIQSLIAKDLNENIISREDEQ